jgi:uncharacterized protein YpuA (DUF1002 family)
MAHSERGKDFTFTKFNDVRNTVLRIQNDLDHLKSMMNLTRIQSFLEAMEQFSKVTEVFLNVSNFLCFIWGPMKYLLQVGT